MSFNRLHSAGFLANHMARLFSRALQARIKPFGLAPAQFMALLELWEHDGLTQKELVKRLDVEQATMANTLSRMERDGLVRRVPHPDDARAQIVHLTEHARNLRTSATEAALSVNSAALSKLSDTEREDFLRLSAKVIDALKASTLA